MPHVLTLNDRYILIFSDREHLAAAREEFWLEAARLARRCLRSGPDRRAGDIGLLTSELRAGAAEAEAEDEDEDGAEAEGC